MAAGRAGDHPGRAAGVTRLLQVLFFALIVRPVLMIVLGVHVRRRELLPQRGPAIIVANHNSHLDTLTLMALYRLRDLHRLRPVAAMDYFLKSRFMRWLAEDLIGIVPVNRVKGAKDGGNPLEGALEALDAGAILILFPEGSRGEAERIAAFRKGIAHLAKARPEVPVTPVFLHGLGKALPKGSMVLVPFTCDVFVGGALRWGEDGEIDAFVAALRARIDAMAEEARVPDWD